MPLPGHNESEHSKKKHFIKKPGQWYTNSDLIPHDILCSFQSVCTHSNESGVCIVCFVFPVTIHSIPIKIRVYLIALKKFNAFSINKQNEVFSCFGFVVFLKIVFNTCKWKGLLIMQSRRVLEQNSRGIFLLDKQTHLIDLNTNRPEHERAQVCSQSEVHDKILNHNRLLRVISSPFTRNLLVYKL